MRWRRSRRWVSFCWIWARRVSPGPLVLGAGPGGSLPGYRGRRPWPSTLPAGLGPWRSRRPGRNRPPAGGPAGPSRGRLPAPQLFPQVQVLPGLLGLGFQGAPLEVQFLQLIPDAHQIFLGALQLRWVSSLLVAAVGDPLPPPQKISRRWVLLAERISSMRPLADEGVPSWPRPVSMKSSFTSRRRTDWPLRRYSLSPGGSTAG